MNFIHKPLMSGIAICLTFFAYSCATPEKTENKTDFTAYVDPYIGSGEHGHVFVGANVPFGAGQVGPQNILRDGTGVPVIITPIVSLSDLVIRI